MRAAASVSSARLWTGAQGAVATPARLRNCFSAMRSWLTRSISGDGRTGLERGQQVEPFGADVLELEADHIDGGGEGAQADRVGVVTKGDAGRDLGGGAVGLAGEDVAAIAEPGGCQGRHAAELTATHQANDGIRGQGKAHAVGRVPSSGVAGTASVWAAR